MVGAVRTFGAAEGQGEGGEEERIVVRVAYVVEGAGWGRRVGDVVRGRRFREWMRRSG